MEELDKNNSYSTELHSDEIDYIFDKQHEDIEDFLRNDDNFYYTFKTYVRYLRKKFTFYLRKNFKKNFTNIIYITLDCPNFTNKSLRDDNPIEFISKLRNQYPENDIRLLIPLINLEEHFKPAKKIFLNLNNETKILEKTNINFKFFLQNRKQEAFIYKFPKNNYNIQVYGIYSKTFSHIKNINDLSKLQYLAPFIKSARIAVKKLKKDNFNIDIVHCENIPYYLGAEFEHKFSNNTKVLQIVKDFTQIDIAKIEAFWAFINLADKKSIKKLCNDLFIKKYISELFSIHNQKKFYKTKDCLNFIYKNYYKLRKFLEKGSEIDENYIFNKLNYRTLKIFSKIAYNDDYYFHPMIYSLKNANYWATISKTYYKEILENPKLSGKMFRYINKSKENSSYISYGLDVKNYPLENTRDIYQNFNIDNFRELRKINKKIILKEFSIDKIRTNFTDPTLFKGNSVKIFGYLDSFYDAPLLFANPNNEFYANGIDILFNTLLKLFELHKNIQVIICIKDGLNINFVKNWIDFLSKNKYLNGRWVL